MPPRMEPRFTECYFYDANKPQILFLVVKDWLEIRI